MSAAHRLRRWFLDVSTTVADDRAILHVTGRLGARDAGLLIDAANAAFTRGARHLLLDVSGVDYIDSAGAIVLEALSGRAAAQGGSIALCVPSAPLRATLAIAPALLDIPVYDTIDAACDAIASAARDQDMSTEPNRH